MMDGPIKMRLLCVGSLATSKSDAISVQYFLDKQYISRALLEGFQFFRKETLINMN